MEETVTISLQRYERLKSIDEAFSKEINNGEVKAIYVHSQYISHAYYVKGINEVTEDIIKYNQELRNRISSLEEEIRGLKKKVDSKLPETIKDRFERDYTVKKWYQIFK
jgi:uncharacterized protein YihD (DUF1040 family)